MYACMYAHVTDLSDGQHMLEILESLVTPFSSIEHHTFQVSHLHIQLLIMIAYCCYAILRSKKRPRPVVQSALQM